ncbi:unnamed protein product, partial [Amoebophrya sp. A120]
ECTGFNFHKRGFPPQSSNCLLEKNSFETGDMTHVKWQTNYDYDVTVLSSGCRSQLLKFLDPWKASFRLAHVMTQIPIPTTCVRDEATTLVGGTDLDGSFSYGSRGASKFSSFEECMLTCAHYPTCNGFVRDPTNGCLLLGWAADASITKSAQSDVDAMEMTAECRKSVLRESEFRTSGVMLSAEDELATSTGASEKLSLAEVEERQLSIPLPQHWWRIP